MLTKQCWDECLSCRGPWYACGLKERDTIMLPEHLPVPQARTISSARDPLRPSCDAASVVTTASEKAADVEAPVPDERTGIKREERAEFRITIDRKRTDKTTLGMNYCDADRQTLVIHGMKNGLLYNWNTSHTSDAWVLIGDSIIECNGVRGNSDDLTEECMKKGILKMTIRPAPLERVLPVCVSDDNDIVVHVYDLWGRRVPIARLWNSLTTRYGAFHTGVEVYGTEFYFSAHPENGFEGVYIMDEPRRHHCHSYRMSIPLGPTSLSRAELESLIPLIRMSWPGWTYNTFSRNCHSFTDSFCKFLGLSGGPKCGLFGVGDNPGAVLQIAHSIERL